MKKIDLVFALGIILWVLSSCGEKKDTAETKGKRTDIIVHDDLKKLSEMIRLPTPVISARWTVVSVVPQSRYDIGPSDYRLYTVVPVDSAHWPTWERVLTASASVGNYYLMEEVAEKLLPGEWLSSAVSDSLGRGRLLSGTFYETDSLASGGFHGGIAVRHGKYFFMSFYTM